MKGIRSALPALYFAFCPFINVAGEATPRFLHRLRLQEENGTGASATVVSTIKTLPSEEEKRAGRQSRYHLPLIILPSRTAKGLRCNEASHDF